MSAAILLLHLLWFLASHLRAPNNELSAVQSNCLTKLIDTSKEWVFHKADRCGSKTGLALVEKKTTCVWYKWCGKRGWKMRQNKCSVSMINRVQETHKHFGDWLSIRCFWKNIRQMSNITLSTSKFWKIKRIMLTFKNSARHDVGGYCVIFMTGRKLRWKRVSDKEE